MHELRRAHIRLKAALAAEQVLLAAQRLRDALKYNPYWHLQPRVPAGNPDGGRWMPSGPLAGASSILPILQGLGRTAIQRLRDAGRRVRPLLRRLPKPWSSDTHVPAETDFDDETRRIGPPSWHRFGHPTMRFRSERELRNILGPAGEGREWHHIVEKRLADSGKFPAEMIHSTDNIINLPVEVHRRISARMSSRSREFGDDIRRFWVERMDFGEQYNHGLRLIRETLEEFGYDPDRF